jgi:hypothetical protein
VDLYNRFFPEAWQVTLVLRPHAYEPTRGGFFFREADGSIRTESSYSEFTLQSRWRRLLVGFDPADPQVRTPLGQQSPRREAVAPTVSGPVAPGPAPVAPEREAFQSGRQRSLREWVLAAVAVCLVISAVVLLGLPSVDSGPAASVSLEVRDVGGQLLLEWDRVAAPVLEAESATLRILDGEADRRIQLTREELRTGSLTYARQTSDVEFDLTLARPDEEPVSEITRFLGDEYVRVSPSALEENLREKQELQAEAERLREQLREQAVRTNEMREAIRILRERLSPSNGDSEAAASSP